MKTIFLIKKIDKIFYKGTQIQHNLKFLLVKDKVITVNK